MSEKPNKKAVHAMLRHIVDLGLDVGPGCLSDLERKYSVDSVTLLSEGYLKRDPESNITTITK